MNNFFLKGLWLCLLCIVCLFLSVDAQVAVKINDAAKQQIFRYNEVFYLEDTKNNRTIDQIKSLAFENKFKVNTEATPVTHDPNAAWWYRVNIVHDPQSKNSWILELFDQTIDSIAVYSPDKQNYYSPILLGSSRPFATRLYQHKNFRLHHK